MRQPSAPDDLSRFSLNTGTLRGQGDLATILAAAARHGVQIVSPWRDQVQGIGITQAARALRDGGFRLSGYCRGGLFPTDPAQRNTVRDDNRRAVDEAVALGAPSLVIVVGGLPQFTRPGSIASNDIAGARRQVDDGIAELLEYAESASLPLALEPLHPMFAAERSCLNTIDQALDICDAVDPAGIRGLGVAIDVYHVWWDPHVYRQIKRIGQRRLLAFHVCDWIVPTTNLMTGRGMMGDGVIEIAKLRAAVEAEGYTGACEVEVLSDHWWAQPVDDVLGLAIERFRTHC